MTVTRGKLAKAAADKAQGKKKVVEDGEGSNRKTPSSTRIRAKEYRAMFRQMTFVGTRYPDQETMESLGILEDCKEMFSMMELDKFMSMTYPTYKAQTIDFLSSLKVHHYEPDEVTPEGEGSGFITFMVRKEKHRVTFTDLEDIYGFSHKDGRQLTSTITKEENDALWDTMASGKFKSSTAKSAQIRSPVLRYVHKALSLTFFARRDTSNVMEKELELINAGIEYSLDVMSNGKKMVGDNSNSSLVTHLIKSFMGYKDWAVNLDKMGKARVGQVSVGGVITPILVHCGVELGEPDFPPLFMNLSYLRKIHFLRAEEVEGKYIYTFAHHDFPVAYTLLPNEALTAIEVKGNIEFLLPFGALYDPTPGAQQPANSDGEPVHVREEAADTDQDAIPEEYLTSEYYFEAYNATGKNVALNAAHKHINLLQQWSKWQDKTIKRLLKTVKKLSAQLRNITPCTPPPQESYSDCEINRDTQAPPQTVPPAEADRSAPRKRKASRSPSLARSSDELISSDSAEI